MSDKKIQYAYVLSNSKDQSNDSLFEFLFLMTTVSFQPYHVFSQNVDVAHPAYYVGKGKLLEIKNTIESGTIIHPFFGLQKPEYLLLNFDVNPLQKKNIESITGLIVIDRTSLILRIFEMNAKTKEAKLQVEIAKFNYMKTQLIDGQASYAQVTGGSRRARGAGEKKIELNRRTIEQIVDYKEKQLEEIKQSRRNMRVKRIKSSLPNIVLVGYTNAGKSTLMNLLLNATKAKDDKKVYVENELFATLETSTRLINTYRYPRFIVTDTVGFIENLPTFLVKAFRSTLEEIKEADLIVHVVDVSSPIYVNHIQATNEVLKELGAGDIPTVYIYNKVDALTNGTPFIPHEGELLASFISEADTDMILEFISESMTKNWMKKTVFVPYEDNFASFLSDNYVASYKEKESGYECVTHFNPKTLHKYSYLFK